jgi:hypothetical protein
VDWSQIDSGIIISIAFLLFIRVVSRAFAGQPKPKDHPQRTFRCFYCNERTSREDGYCSDEHREQDLRTIFVQRD